MCRPRPKQGSLVFHGIPKQLVPYFADLGYQCPRYVNPADYVMKLLRTEGVGSEARYVWVGTGAVQPAGIDLPLEL